MLYIKRFLLFVILLAPIYSHAQNVCNLSIKGRILDADTNLPLSNSTIHLQQGNIETQTDGHGFFNFDQLCQGDYTLQITILGFKKQEYKVTLPQDTPLITILLEHEGIVLHDVEVIGHQPAVRTT